MKFQKLLIQHPGIIIISLLAALQLFYIETSCTIVRHRCRSDECDSTCFECTGKGTRNTNNGRIQISYVAHAFTPCSLHISITSTRSSHHYHQLIDIFKKRNHGLHSLLIMKQQNSSADDNTEEEEGTTSSRRGKSNTTNNHSKRLKSNNNNNSSSSSSSSSRHNSSSDKDNNISMQNTKSINKNKSKNSTSSNNNNTTKSQKKGKSQSKKKNNNFINLLSNPYEAGVQFRQTVDRTLNLNIKKPLTSAQKSIYYLDDRFLDSGSAGSSTYSIPSEGALDFLERNSNQNNFNEYVDTNTYSKYAGDNDYIPEVLVIGATSAIGRLVVKRLLLSNKFKVRVLVHNLYSNTLNMLGTGVTYCQGELYNMESLEYALTDVDKIVFCESPPQKDELDYQMKFDQFVQDTLQENEKEPSQNKQDNVTGDESSEFIDQLSELIEMKAKIAEQVDCIGMKNVLCAYQNVRHADYGTSQAAKRSLFKFQSREEDFGLFSIHFDDDDVVEMNTIDTEEENASNDEYEETAMSNNNEMKVNKYYDKMGCYDDDYGDYYNDKYNEDNYAMNNSYITSKNANQKKSTLAKLKPITSSIKTQVNWIKNKFKHGVFVGKIPSYQQQGGSEASIISSRLRSRDDPERGIDLSNGGFAGFVCRLCSDGKTYEAFVRTSDYELNGVEYICKFQSTSKANIGNKSGNKFTTVRLPFSNFVPVERQKRGISSKPVDEQFKSFNGNDVKQIGFRICSADNISINSSIDSRIKGKTNDSKWISFYLALSYIKVFRMQPEPEFIYLSDARLGNIDKEMVNHQLKQVILPKNENEQSNGGTTLFDEEEAKRVITNRKDRSAQELYYKYCGEEMLKHSGLTYSIVRIPELNELASGEFSTLRLKQSNDNLTTVSRAEVAAVCESALLDPNARNVCFFITKTSPGEKAKYIDPSISLQFLQLKPDM